MQILWPQRVPQHFSLPGQSLSCLHVLVQEMGHHIDESKSTSIGIGTRGQCPGLTTKHERILKSSLFQEP